jgi:hypothetical protein
MKRQLLLFSAALIIFFAATAFLQEEHFFVPPKTISIISDAANDGFIINSKPAVLKSFQQGSQGKEIQIGWNEKGKAMRGFLSFDVMKLLPKDPKQKLIIDAATLNIYESNTNMHPFDGEGKRTVQLFLVDYGKLETKDFNIEAVSGCGTIAKWGYNVLNKHSLNVTDKLNTYLGSKPEATAFQFRLQFTNDKNVNPAQSELEKSMWCIFSGDESDYKDYRPVLSLKYHCGKK